jgi:type II secretory pathway component PulM
MKGPWVKWKEWWSSLTLHEKQGAALSVSLLVIFIVYQWIWAPYLDHVDAIRKRISTDQKLWVWMQRTDKAISKIESQSKHKNKAASPVMILSLMKKQVGQAGLEQFLTQLKQATNGSVELHFQKVEFDKLIRLLMTMMKEQQVTILQMSVVADTTPGTVNADMMLKSG